MHILYVSAYDPYYTKYTTCIAKYFYKKIRLADRKSVNLIFYFFKLLSA